MGYRIAARATAKRSAHAHFSFLDYLFGTAARADRPWPDRYGVVGDYVPKRFFAQQSFPFVGWMANRENERDDPHARARVTLRVDV